MKRILGLLSLLMMTTTLLAIPAKRGVVRMLKTADGQEVRAQLVGDEHAHYYLGADGKTYVLQAGLAVEADAAQLQAKAAARRAAANKSRSARLARRKVGGAGKVFEGKKKGLIILAEYTDVKFEEGHDKALFTRIANEKGFSQDDFRGSVSDYFLAQSGGTFELDFDVYGPVPLAKNQAYYGGNNSADEDQRPEEMVVEACKAVDSQVNFKDYDWDGDGEVDQVFILYAGLGEANGGDEDTVWPHEWQLSEAGKSLTLDGVKIDTYACSSELTGYDFDWMGNVTESGIDGIGTICHEFSHCLGFPDMYDTSYRYFGMGPWDLMDSGSYNGDGFCPAGYTSYEKMVAGWLNPIELTGDMEVSDMKALSEGGNAYIIYNKGHKEEFYLLENRQLSSWDAELLGHGLLVLHVDYDEDVWYNNQVNNASRQRCTIIPADNALKMVLYEGNYYVDDEDVPGDPFPYEGNNKLTNTSKPKASVYNANSDGSKLMNIELTDITENANGTIAFKFTDKVEPPTPGPTPDGALFYESFDQCAGKGGNDGVWSGSIATAEFSTDNAGWVSEKAYGADKCAKFGNSSLAGLVTTPSITIDGDATLSFRAGAWDAKNDGTELSLTVNGTGVTLSEATFTIEKGDWTDCVVDLKGAGTFTLTFATTKRFFLDEVIVKSKTTGIIAPAIQRTSASTVYDLQGRRLNATFDQLPQGIYVVDGKKVVK